MSSKISEGRLPFTVQSIWVYLSDKSEKLRNCGAFALFETELFFLFDSSYTLRVSSVGPSNITVPFSGRLNARRFL